MVAAQNFPEAQVRQTLTEGLAASPDGTLWVTRASNRGAEQLISDLLRSYQLVVLSPNALFRYVTPNGRKIDDRSLVRDYEIILCCSKVVVFHLPNSTTSRFKEMSKYHPHIYIVEAAP